LEALFTGMGFEDFAITWRKDVFDDTPQQSSADQFDTKGITFKARLPR